jgi:hypothetical protein
MISSRSKQSQTARVSLGVAGRLSNSAFEYLSSWQGLGTSQKRWAVLLPIVFAGNVLVATLAWILVAIAID